MGLTTIATAGWFDAATAESVATAGWYPTDETPPEPEVSSVGSAILPPRRRKDVRKKNTETLLLMFLDDW